MFLCWDDKKKNRRTLFTLENYHMFGFKLQDAKKNMHTTNEQFLSVGIFHIVATL